ncbi:MAG: CRISPR-associated endonuclease Cas1 [Puniceicoccales bacterium]|nr:CRISPR-associated endonuclease Cas1 [Puniceicoccales bacterium]
MPETDAGDPDTPVAAAHSRQRNVPLAEVERVLVGDTASLTTPALVALLERGITVVFQNHRHTPAGVTVGARRNTAPLMAQLDTHRDPAARLDAARALIAAKTLNMRRVLQRLAATRGRDISAVAAMLTELARLAAHCASLETLRGIEGTAAGCYFASLDEFFPPELPFERRSRRPPHNPANALLSYLYTLLTTEALTLLHLHGLEPAWGFLHETDDYKPALALDIIEPYRAPLCDSLALDLLNHKRLAPDDFRAGNATGKTTDGNAGNAIGGDGSGFYLNTGARRIVHAAWEERLERDFFHEQTQTRTTLRRSLEDLCLNTRRYFTDRRPLEPFLMN